MLNQQDPFIRFKLDFLKQAMPADDAVVFGDMYIVEGGYTQKCLEYGCAHAVLIDTLETKNWLDTRKANPRLDFYKGDFANPFFMRSIDEQFDIGVVFDILLHQAPLLHTIHLMLEKVRDKFVIVQPMLREQEIANTLVYLPGNRDAANLYPLGGKDPDYNMFDINQVNQSHWLWGMTCSFLESVLAGEGFEITHDREYQDCPNDQWFWWGCIAERKHDVSPMHWSQMKPTKGLFEANW
jgi:hypothetical protein